MSDIKCGTCGSSYLSTLGGQPSHYTSCPKCNTQIEICAFCYSHGWATNDIYPWQETKLEEICEHQIGSICLRDKKIDICLH